MTEKDYKIRILELSVAVQTQSISIEILTRTIARLHFELAQLPGGMDIIKEMAAENDVVDDYDDDSFSKAKILQLVKNDDDSDSDSDD